MYGLGGAGGDSSRAAPGGDAMARLRERVLGPSKSVVIDTTGARGVAAAPAAASPTSSVATHVTDAGTSHGTVAPDYASAHLRKILGPKRTVVIDMTKGVTAAPAASSATSSVATHATDAGTSHGTNASGAAVAAAAAPPYQEAGATSSAGGAAGASRDAATTDTRATPPTATILPTATITPVDGARAIGDEAEVTEAHVLPGADLERRTEELGDEEVMADLSQTAPVGAIPVEGHDDVVEEEEIAYAAPTPTAVPTAAPAPHIVIEHHLPNHTANYLLGLGDLFEHTSDH